MKDKKKKIIKVIQVIYDILSLGFIVFVVVAMAIAPKSDRRSNNNENQITEKVKRNYGYNDEYGIQLTMSYSDLISDYFITHFISAVGDQYDPRILPNDTNNFTCYFANTKSQIFYLNSDLSYPNDAYWNNVNRMYLEKLYIGDLDISGNEVLKFDYYLSFFNDDVKLSTIVYQCVIPLLDPHNLNEVGGLQVINSSYSYIRGNLDVQRLLVYENDNDGFCPIIQYFHKPIIQGRVDRYNEGYQNGYNRGYNSGYKIGKNEGYDSGYVEGAQGIETNAFTAMTQAFGAIANIFNIQVLPNLPLWVLVFAPLIVAVVIVIVKLIKG